MLVLQFVVVPAPPDFDADVTEIREYLVDNRSGILTTGLLQLLAVTFFGLFLVGLRDVIRRTEDGPYWSTVAVLGGVLLGATVLVAQSTYAAMVWVDGAAQDASDDLLRFAWSLSNVVFGVGAPGILLLTGTVAWVGIKEKAVPAATAWVSALAAVVSAVGFIMQLGSDFGAFGIATFLGFVAFAVFTAVPMARGSMAATNARR